MFRIVLSVLALVALTGAHDPHARVKGMPDNPAFNNPDTDAAEDSDYWLMLGEEEIDNALAAIPWNERVAKNIIVFIGDGMSIPTLTAARIYKAQLQDEDFDRPEKNYLTMERFPHMGHSKTYDINTQTADSSATASAIYSGIKTKHATLGYDSFIDHNDVGSMRTAKKVDTVAKLAIQAGKDAGFVTTARLTHATPSALYAHSYDRNWECDSNFNDLDGSVEQPDDLFDIAHQFVYGDVGPYMKVALGGGYPAFYPVEMKDELYEELGRYREDWEYCFRSDGRNLAQEWKDIHTNAQYKAEVALNLDQLNKVDLDETDFLLGLFAESYVEYDDARNLTRDPDIVQMAETAFHMLSKGDNGFFLMVEGGRIDLAHHEVTARRALHETVAFDRSIEAIIAKLEEIGELDDTLIIVTADHAHTMSISGYAIRGTDIAGLSGEIYEDNLGYTTLGYANGNAYNEYHKADPENAQEASRVNPEEIIARYSEEPFFMPYTSAGPLGYETHGGDDVAIFAKGPYAHLFHRAHEQSYIGHVMMYAGCLGRYSDYEHCTSDPAATNTPPPTDDPKQTTDGGGSVVASLTLVSSALVLAVKAQ